jgi:hypothetical protein
VILSLTARRINRLGTAFVECPTDSGRETRLILLVPKPPIRGQMKLLMMRVRSIASDEGSATAEYAIATLAAVGFAGLLVVILRSGEVRGLLTGLIRHALSFAN